MKCVVCADREGGCEYCPEVDASSVPERVNGGTVMEMQLESDENGYELHLWNADGTKFSFNVHLAALQLVPIGLEIANYFREGERLAASHVPPASEADLDGYELNDPKRISLVREGGRL